MTALYCDLGRQDKCSFAEKSYSTAPSLQLHVFVHVVLQSSLQGLKPIQKSEKCTNADADQSQNLIKTKFCYADGR